MEEAGWTKRWRAMWKKGYHRDHLLWVMMSYFIDFAEWEDTKIFWPAAGKRIEVKRGQHIFSTRELAKYMGTDRQRIRTRLDLMLAIGFSTHQVTHRYTILTVLNYGKYQDIPEHIKPSDKPSANPALTQPPYYKEGEEGKEEPPCIPPQGKKPRKTTPPEIFPITPEMQSYADRKNFTGDITDATDAFLNHHRARDTRFLDWNAAWQNWIRNEIKFNRNGGSRAAGQTRQDRNRETTRRNLNRFIEIAEGKFNE